MYLTKYVGVDLKAFFAIQEGDAWTVGQDVNQMLTYGHLGPWDPSLAVGSNVLAGNPLHPGAVTLAANTTYTVWIQQTGSNITEYALSTNPYWVPATADLPADYSSDPATPTILYQDGAGTGTGGVSVEDSVPTTTDSGSLWLDTNTGILYVYYDDGTSGQWIQPTFPYPDVTNLATISSLSAVATSGNYSDLVNTPSQFELSVAADDSTQISISSGETVRFVGAGGVTTTSDPDGTITITGGGTTGNVTFSTTTIDSTDSSAIIFTPAVVMQSDLTVQNDLTVSNLLTTTSIDVTSIDVDNIRLTGSLTTQGSGTPEIVSDNEILLTAGTRVSLTSSPLKLASFTSAARDLLIASNGDMIYNTTTNKFQGRANGVWVDLH